MSIWFNVPKKDSVFATLGYSDWKGLNSRIEFSEAIIRKETNGYSVFCYATNVSDCKMFSNKDWVFQPCLVSLRFYATAYEKTQKDKDTGKYSQVKTEPFPTEIYLCKEFDKIDTVTCYKGEIILYDDEKSLNVLSAYQDGQSTDPVMVSFLQKYYYTLMPNGELDKLKGVELPDDASSSNNKNYGGSGGSKTQLEAERLKERFEFTKFCLGDYGKDASTVVQMAIELQELKTSLPGVYETVIQLMEMLLPS